MYDFRISIYSIQFDVLILDDDLNLSILYLMIVYGYLLERVHRHTSYKWILLYVE